MDKFESFCAIFPFSTTTQVEQAVAFLWFHVRSTDADEADFNEIRDYFVWASLSSPNTTRLRSALSKSKAVHRGTTPTKYRLAREVRDELDEAYGHILATESSVVDRAGVESTPLLTESDIEDARRMAELYVILHCYENSVRHLVKNTLSQKLGPQWWDQASSAGMRAKLKSRKESEERNRWLTPRGNSSPLYYVDWGDLLTLMRKYESDFLPKIKDIKFAELRFEELEKLRNIVAHHGALPSEEDFQRVVLSFRDWCRQLSA